MPAIIVGIRTDDSHDKNVRTMISSSQYDFGHGDPTRRLLLTRLAAPSPIRAVVDFSSNISHSRTTCGGSTAPGSTGPVDCSQLDDSISGQCVEYTGFPPQISGINVDVYHYVDGWTTPNPTGDLNLAAIGNAISTVLPVYSKFAPPFNVIIVLIKAYNDITNTDLGSTTSDLPDGTPCAVLILEQPNNGIDPSFSVEQTTAHELYHCIELRNQGVGLPEHDGLEWWWEGSAEYFANTFYPSTSLTSFIKLYDPNVALYDHSYNPSIFFQFLSNQDWSGDAINGFVTQQIQAAQAGGSERAIMSNNADLQRLFPIFAQKFSALAITFPDGSLAQGNPGTPISPFCKIELNTLQSDGQQHATDMGVISFAMSMCTATLQPGITYSIQWAPSAQDTKTVLAYQQIGDISGSTWTTINPATPIQIPIDCSSDPVQYKFLLTSTADVDMSNGQLTIVRQSSQSCGCNDVGISLDPCLSGNWNLDLNDFQTYLQGAAATTQGISMGNLVVSGASTLDIPVGGGIGEMTFDALDMDYDATASGYSMHTTIDLTGSVSGQVVMQAPGQFCWADGQGQGQANTSTTIVGLGGPYELDTPLVTAYAAPTITIKYTCSATSLQLVGSDGGQYAWALSYVKD